MLQAAESVSTPGAGAWPDKIWADTAMQIGTSYNLLFGLPITTGTAGLTARSQTTADTTSFGPPAQVSIVDSAPTVTGFRDYTKIVDTTVPQFDLAAVLSPQSTGLPQMVRSEEQQKAEQAAIKQALNYLDGGSPDAARELMDALLDENPTNAAAVQVLGLVEQDQGRYEQAEQLFLKAHALNPTVGYDNDARNVRILQQDDDHVLDRARAMAATPTQREDGIRLLIALTERSPGFGAANMLLGDSLLRVGDVANGLMQYNSAINNADTGLLGTLETRLRELGKVDPGSAFVQKLLGKTLLSLERYEDAVQVLTHARQLAQGAPGYEGDLARAEIGIGRELLERGDVTGAMSRFQRAKQIDPTGRDVKLALSEGYLARAEQHMRRRDYHSALDDYDLAARTLGDERGTDELRQRAAHGVYSVGRSLEQRRIASGEEIDAEARAYQLAYDLDPENTTYKHKLAQTRFALGEQLTAEGEYKRAAYSYRQAYELYQGNTEYKQKAVDALVTYAEQRMSALDFDDAIQAYRDAWLIDLDDIAVKQKLADAYNARGLDYLDWEKPEKAVYDFKEALRLFPDNEEYQANYDRVWVWDDYAW
jgi:tetratricopeptide (TPR) repeat protein